MQYFSFEGYSPEKLVELLKKRDWTYQPMQLIKKFTAISLGNDCLHNAPPYTTNAIKIKIELIELISQDSFSVTGYTHNAKDKNFLGLAAANPFKVSFAGFCLKNLSYKEYCESKDVLLPYRCIMRVVV
ncbi:MAG: hypothetical protein HYT12_04740 [Candidatus Liptonbacteria bacterium]|nr:hypothetical protein [Candidatus Liptonbacteria bacterium]